MRAAEVAFRLPAHIAEQFSDQIREEMIRDAQSFARWEIESNGWFNQFARNNEEKMEASERVRQKMLEHIPRRWMSSQELANFLVARMGRDMNRDKMVYHMSAMVGDGRARRKKENGKSYWRRA